MYAEFGFGPPPEEGTESFALLGLTEERGVMTCRGEAPDPHAAAEALTGEPWRPGHCARYAALTLR